jgi:hypothetical protein
MAKTPGPHPYLRSTNRAIIMLSAMRLSRMISSHLFEAYLECPWRTHNGPEGFDCLIIGQVFRWGQIRTQDALSVPQSPFDREIVLHGSRMSATSSFAI